MGISRVTQNMLSQRSLESLQTGLTRLATIQEHLSTGRVLNRPSDSPTDVSATMRLRSSMSDQQQYSRNAQDGLGWLGQIDATLSSVTDQVRRARELALQGANSGSMSAASRNALATEVDQILAGVVASANTDYLGRPVFGGITAGSQAYDSAGTFIGTSGAVNRTVGAGVSVRVDVDGPTVFGAAGSSVFDDLSALSTALSTNNTAGITAGITALSGHLDKLTTTLSDVGTRYLRLQQADQAAQDKHLTLSNSLATIEGTDLPKATVELQMQQVAYQAALASTARVMQPSLLEFLR